VLNQNVFGGDGQAIFGESFHIKLGSFADILNTFLDRLALGMASGKTGQKT
jgi:hypothetical protein